MTVGTVTFQPYEGNPKPRLYRLKKSQALVVNYGLKNIGVNKIVQRLKNYNKPEDFILGISVGKTNCPETAETERGAEDYLNCLKILNDNNIGDFYEINISCPNTFGGEPFTTPEKLDLLLSRLTTSYFLKPIFLKMPINAGYEFFNAEKAYLEATSIDQKISCLEEMIRTAPKHKSSENFVAGLKTRLKKLIEKKEKSKKTGKSSIRGIKKEGYQVVLVGFSNSGKSSILVKLTNAHSKISPVKFTTKSSQPGTLYYQGYHLQIIEVPAIESEFFDSGIINTADLILIIITKLEEYQRIIPYLSKATNNRLLIINKSDLLDSNQIRKLNPKK